jgi:hypothetical protein
MWYNIYEYLSKRHLDVRLSNPAKTRAIATHIFTKGYIEKLKELNDYRINGYLHIIESLNDEINTVSKKILMLAKMKWPDY